RNAAGVIWNRPGRCRNDTERKAMTRFCTPAAPMNRLLELFALLALTAGAIWCVCTAASVLMWVYRILTGG
ncbi:MAG: hypothetical protein KGL39_43075, partial [Patescibacteria group bacterium]|nr:hypothetical protein [Patescibacteria group bacterium]